MTIEKKVCMNIDATLVALFRIDSSQNIEELQNLISQVSIFVFFF